MTIKPRVVTLVYIMIKYGNMVTHLRDNKEIEKLILENNQGYDFGYFHIF